MKSSNSLEGFIIKYSFPTANPKLLSHLMFRIIFLLLFLYKGFNAYSQSKKVALVIQNRKFKDWTSFKRLEKNKNSVIQMFKTQGHTTPNIIGVEDVNADSTRKSFEKLIKHLSSGDLCTVFLGSHGGQFIDKNGDERLHGNPEDNLDEYFVCTDTPKVIQEKEIKTDTRRGNTHPNAITDDEIAWYNQRIIDKIGPKGQYILLADYCHSDNSERGGNAEIFDGWDYTDFFGYDDNSNKKNLSPTLPPFLTLAATSTSIQVADDEVSFFVDALIKAFNSFKFFKPTFNSLYVRVKSFLTSLNIEGASPTLREKTPGDATNLVFKGQWETVQSKIITSIAKYIEGARGDESKDFSVPNPYNFYKNMIVDIYEGPLLMGEGVIASANNETISVIFLNKYNPKSNTDYEFRLSQRYESANKLLNNAINTHDLELVYRQLATYPIHAQACVNAYEIIGDDRISKGLPCDPIGNYKELDTNDNITFFIHTNKMDPTFYYTILDVNPENIKYYFENKDTTTADSFLSVLQPDTIKTRVTEPVGKCAFWVLLSDMPISGEEVTMLLGKKLTNDNKAKLKSLIPHIIGFQSIPFNVVKSRKR